MIRLRLPRLALPLTLGGLALAGCALVSPAPCISTEQPMVSELLYFGTAKPGGVVSRREWAAFLGSAVTPRFPSGLSSWPASGQWRSADGALTRENAHVLSLLHAPDDASEEAVRAVMAQYKAQFSQEAVLRVRSPACVSF